ncbi:hypothetical protein ACFPYJ_31355 [Paenibacillus solisilvae]|uniref:Uncharacterized protein n=1 Tax=Paenibacillus solisilvae TaxID=2486751 RepID=A0ABW0W6Q3_9BACL
MQANHTTHRHRIVIVIASSSSSHRHRIVIASSSILDVYSYFGL